MLDTARHSKSKTLRVLTQSSKLSDTGYLWCSSVTAQHKQKAHKKVRERRSGSRKSTVADLLEGLLHLLKVRLLVEVGRHDFGKQRLQHIGKGEEQQATQQAAQRSESVLHVVVGEILGVEAAHKQRSHQCDSQETPQGFLQECADNDKFNCMKSEDSPRHLAQE